jgi:hypothetical protein
MVNMTTKKVRSPIIKHIFMIKHNPYHTHFWSILNNLYGYMCGKWIFIIPFGIPKTRKQQRRRTKRMSHPNHKMFQKRTLDPPYFLTPYLPHFLFVFEWSKNLWVCKLEFYKTFWILKAMKMPKGFSSKLQIVLIFLSLNITPLFRNVVFFSFFVICSDLHGYGVPSEGLQ